MTRGGKQDWSPRDMPSDRPLNAQPKWEFVANLGDRSPLDYGGYFVYQDATGVYEDEAVLLQANEDDTYVIWRINLERYKRVDGHLVPIKYDATWRHSIERYAPWFEKDLPGVAETMNTTVEDLEAALKSVDPVTRAVAYRDIADYLGWVNFDEYPLTGMTRAQVKKRYRKELRKIKEQL